MNTYILVVDDAEDTRNLLKFALEREGLNVILVASGQEALTFLSNFIPHIIVVDLLMPEMSGLDLIKVIRSLPEFAPTPIIVLSAYADGWFEEAKAAGASVILQKPIDTLILPNIIKQFLSQAQAIA